MTWMNRLETLRNILRIYSSLIVAACRKAGLEWVVGQGQVMQRHNVGEYFPYVCDEEFIRIYQCLANGLDGYTLWKTVEAVLPVHHFIHPIECFV